MTRVADFKNIYIYIFTLPEYHFFNTKKKKISPGGPRNHKDVLCA
jgi:hypothetical protein